MIQLEKDRSKVILQWNKPTKPDFDHYILKVLKEGDATFGTCWEDAKKIVDNYDLSEDYIYTLPDSGTYTFMIKGVNIAGIESKNPLSVTQAYTVEPTSLTTPTTSFIVDPSNSTSIKVIWNPCTDGDFDHYEICYRVWTDDANKIVTKNNYINFTIYDSNPHVFLVKAFNKAGYSTPILTISNFASVCPTDITGLTVVQSLEDKRNFSISWDASTSTDLDSYEVRIGDNTSTWDTATVRIPGISTTSFSTSISIEGNYKIFVKAKNKAGYYSENSTSYDLAVSLKPSNVIVAQVIWDSAERNKINVKWDRISDGDVTVYEIKEHSKAWSDSSVIVTKDNFATFTLTISGQYVFDIRAKNIGGFYSDSTTFACASYSKLEPSDVTGITMNQSNLDKRNFTLSWNAISDTDLDYYVVSYENSSQGITKQVLVPSVKVSYCSVTVSAQTAYTFYVKAVNKLGKISLTEGSLVYTPSLIPSTPTGLTATQGDLNTDEVTLSWNGISDVDLDYYEIKLSTEDWSAAKKVYGTSYVKSFTGVNSGSFTFNLRAKNKAGFYSPSIDLLKSLTFEPADISNFLVTYNPKDRRNLLMSWNIPIDKNIAYYVVKKDNWSTGATIASNVIPNYFNDHFVYAEGQETYFIKAINKQGRESVTPTSFLYNSVLTPTRPASGTVTISTINRFRATISWSAISDFDLDGYEVVYRTPVGVETIIYYGKETSLIYDLSLEEGTHTIRIRSKNISGFYSSTLSLTTSVNTSASDVTNFSVSQSALDRRILNFVWNRNTDLDFAYYEIRKGASWDTGTVIVSNLKVNSYDSLVSVAEEGAKYYIKAFNNGGVGSSNATLATVDIRLVPLKPMSGIVSHDINNKGNILISWEHSADSDITSYTLKVNGVVASIQKETTYSYSPSEYNTTSYTFEITAKNVGGYISPILTLTFTANFFPSDVVGFTVSQSTLDHTKISLVWDSPTDKDVQGYKIVRTRDGSAEVKNYTGITQTFYEDTIDNEDVFTWSIVAVNKIGKESQNHTVYTSAFNMNPSAPTNIILTQDTADRSVAYISFTGITQQDLKEYDIRVGSDWNTATQIIKTKETTNIKWSPSITGNYRILIKAINNAGYYSDEASSSPTILTLEPSQVQNFKIIQNGTSLLFTWDKSTEPDVISYEIREGAQFENGSIIESGITVTTYSLPVDMEITRQFHIKAINLSGRYSSTSASSLISISDLPIKNVVNLYQEMPEGYFDFDGSTVINVAGNITTSTVYTVEFWTKFEGINCMPCGFGNSTSGIDLWLASSYVLGFNTWAHAPYGVDISDLVNDNLWHFVVAEFRSTVSNCKMWIDGIAQTLSGASSTDSISSLPNTFTIGAGRVGSSSYKFNGKLKQVRIYNRTFTDNQVYDHFKGNYAESDSSLINYWRLDDLTGTTAKDRAGVCPGTVSGNNGWGLDILGTASNVDFGQSNITCANAGSVTGKYLASDYKDLDGLPTTRCNEIGGDIVMKLAKDGDNYYTSGSYTVVQKDMGQRITANIASQFVSSNILSIGSNAKFQYRTSTDGSMWTAWRDFSPIQATFRYIEFRVLLSTSDVTKTPEVSTLKELIDVPDKDKYGIINVPVGGLWVHFDPNSTDASPLNYFYQKPSVVATASEQGKYAVVSEANISLYRFNVIVYNSSGTDVGGKVMWIAKGY